MRSRYQLERTFVWLQLGSIIRHALASGYSWLHIMNRGLMPTNAQRLIGAITGDNLRLVTAIRLGSRQSRLRNDLPMQVAIRRLGDHGPISKQIEGYFRFVCPACEELRATVNPRNNLAHCFCCGRNWNNIDLLIDLGWDVLPAVDLLEQ